VKLYISLIVILLGVNFAFSQQKVFKQYEYPNGVISSEGFLVDNKPEGVWKSYYPNGVLKSVGIRTNFQLDSVWSFYNEKGDLIEKISYKEGKRNGYTIGYYVDTKNTEYKGNVKHKELYVNNKKSGISTYYYPNGILKNRINYSENKKEGLSFDYDKLGNLVTIKEFMQDVLITRKYVNRYDREERKTGVWVTLHSNFVVHTEAEYKSDLLHGYYREFNTNGTLMNSLYYEEGKLKEESEIDIQEVEQKEYVNENGNLVKGAFRNSIPIGIHREFRDNKVVNGIIYGEHGKISAEGIVEMDGSKNGNWVNYYDNAVVSSKGAYKNNKRNGKWYFYYPSGKLKQTGNYLNGKTDGVWYWYYENGDTLRIEEYAYGYESGFFEEFDQFGNRILFGEYIDGLREGDWTYSVGDHIEKGNYVNGVKDGKWKHYYETGELKFEGDFIQGSPDGRHKFYYKNGVLREEQYYISGYKEGNWKKFDELGNELIVITYKNDKETRINGVKIADK
jgi:antitoxin component YwqK of YwqJK toxin-antitoxin module